MAETIDTYDDRIAEASDADELLDAAETVATEAAESLADSRPVCAACARPPLSKEAARDVPRVRRVEEFAAEVKERYENMTGEKAAFWVENEVVYDTYEEAFYAALTVDGCDVCRDRAAGGLPDCGHTNNGDPCPLED